MWLGRWSKPNGGRYCAANTSLLLRLRSLGGWAVSIGTRKALVATGKEAFVKLREAAGVYGELA